MKLKINESHKLADLMEIFPTGCVHDEVCNFHTFCPNLPKYLIGDVTVLYVFIFRQWHPLF